MGGHRESFESVFARKRAGRLPATQSHIEADWRLNEPDAKILLQFNEPPARGFPQKLIDAGILPLLTTTACFVAPLVDRKQLAREQGYGALELFLVAHSGAVDSPLTDQKFAFFSETLKKPSVLDWKGVCCHGH
jgi:hypothetical protein